MNLQTPSITIADFDEFALRPENSDLLLEFVAGEISEVVSSPISSAIAGRIVIYIGMYLLQHPIAHITPPDGGYQVGDERYIPEVGILLKSRQPELPAEGYIPNAPDLAVEVISPNDSEKKVRRKAANYVAAQTVVWLVYLHEKIVEVHVPNQPLRILGLNDTLDGASVLPDFSLPIKNIFEV